MTPASEVQSWTWVQWVHKGCCFASGHWQHWQRLCNACSSFACMVFRRAFGQHTCQSPAWQAHSGVWGGGSMAISLEACTCHEGVLCLWLQLVPGCSSPGSGGLDGHCNAFGYSVIELSGCMQQQSANIYGYVLASTTMFVQHQSNCPPFNCTVMQCARSVCVWSLGFHHTQQDWMHCSCIYLAGAMTWSQYNMARKATHGSQPQTDSCQLPVNCLVGSVRFEVDVH